MNFLTNAVKCTHAGFIKMGYSIENEGIRFYVQDSGVGIPVELQDRVFGRFQKLNEFAQGTGLGLAISRAIIEGAGGENRLYFQSRHRFHFLGMDSLQNRYAGEGGNTRN